MNLGCALTPHSHASCFESEPVTRVRIEGSTVLFVVGEGRAVASNGTIEIDLATGSICPRSNDAILGESTALLCHETFDLDDTSAASAHWSQNGCGGVDLMVSGALDSPDIPCIAQIYRAEEIGPDSNWGGDHAAGEEGSLLMNHLGNAREVMHDGDWFEGDTAYLGFRMRDASGKVLYGWAEIAVSLSGVTVLKFAYDRSGNAIRAGGVAA